MAGADWSHPGLTDPYADVLTLHIPGRDVDAITLQKSTPSNLPDGAMAYDRSTDLFKEWSLSGLAFVNKKLSIAGGGTGADNSTQAKINLGLGTMASQDSSAVTITGGSISGVTVDASVLTSGVVALARGGTGANLALGSSGTILQSNGSAVVFGTDGSALVNLNGSNISSGTIALARLPAGLGKIAQLVSSVTSSAYTLTSSYAAVTGHTIIITPLYNTSTVKVTFSVAWLLGVNAGFNGHIGLRIKRNGSVIYTKATVAYLGNGASSTSTIGGRDFIEFVDSPATLSACTYQLEGIVTFAGSGFGNINLDADVEPMTAIEITA